MKKGMFYGWKDVFAFSFKQTAGAKFKRNTTIVGIILLLVGIVVCSIMAFSQKKSDSKVYEIEKVYVVDESELQTLYWDGFLEESKEKFPKVSFETATGDVKTVAGQLAGENVKDIVLHIEKSNTGFLLTAVLPQGASNSQSDVEDFCDSIMFSMEQSKLISSGIPMEKLVVAMSGVNSNVVTAGEQEKSDGEVFAARMMPMLITLAMFFIVYMNGITIGNSVSIEKTSKLMEMMLTLTKPYALIIGKISAIALTALLQFIIWIGCLVGGFVVGNQIALNAIYPEYNNILFEVLNLMKNADGSSAFSIPAIILTAISVVFGFLFYCMIAGFFASFATKAEEVGSVMSFFMIISMVSFYVAYFTAFAEEPGLMNEIVRFIPFVSAFILPADILVGNVALWLGAIQILILVVAFIIVGIIAGKMYKNQVFYRGKSLLERLKKKKEA